MQNKSLWGNFLNGYYGDKATNNSTQSENQKRIQSYDEFEKAFYEKHQVEAEEPVVPEENEYLKNDVNVDKSLKSTLGLDEKPERNLDEVSDDELAMFKLLNGIDDENMVVDQPTETKVKSVKVSKSEKVEKTEKKQRVKAEKKQTKAAK